MKVTPKIWLTKIVELGFLPTDTADLRLKKVAMTMVPLIIAPLALIWGTIYMLLGHILSGSIPMSYAVISTLSLAYYFKTKETQFIQYSQLLLVLLLPFLLMWSLGGFSGGSMVMIWAIFSPIAAMMFLEKLPALLWFLAYFALILISVLIDDVLAANVAHLPDLAKSVFYLLNLGFGSAGLYLLVSYSISEEKRAVKADLRVAASAFEAQEGLMITDARGEILRINQAFTDSTGYTADEIIGKTPRILKSNRHNEDFYRDMWASITQTGAWQGEIFNRRKNGDIYPIWLTISSVKGDDRVVTHYVGAQQDISERKEAEANIRRLAFYDQLTRLPNRQLLLDRLRHALISSVRSRKKGALLFIDLDNFKTLNDTLGHAMGDLLLQQVAERLSACVRNSDTVARLGGDEFVVMLEELSDQTIGTAEQVQMVGDKIIAALNQSFQLNSHVFRTSGSVGATIFSDSSQDAEELLKQADIAMYEAKKGGRNALRFFDHKMQEVINARAVMENELHTALEKQQFQLHYQIQVDGSRQTIGAEALIRWIHPERGIVSPAQFISLAEETGLILPMGAWILETACKQLKAWEHHAKTKNISLSVNISARQFNQADFVEQIRNVVHQHSINPHLLKLELTESLFLEDTEDTVATMMGLKKIGVQLSLDDFGTGYSSLQYLKLLPLDQIKIDQSFVSDIVTDANDAAIVLTIIAMTKTLGLDVIAEGVETEEQCTFLGLQGCHSYQGYLFGKPMSIEQFEAALN